MGGIKQLMDKIRRRWVVGAEFTPYIPPTKGQPDDKYKNKEIGRSQLIIDPHWL